MVPGFNLLIDRVADLCKEAVWAATRNMDPQVRKRITDAAEFVVRHEWKIQAVGIAFAVTLALLVNEFDRILKALDWIVPPAAVAAAALLSGALLFLLRSKRRVVYASSELLFASITCFYAAADLSARPAESAFKLVAGAYLVVRGLDNMMVGLEERGKALAAQGVTQDVRL